MGAAGAAVMLLCWSYFHDIGVHDVVRWNLKQVSRAIRQSTGTPFCRLSQDAIPRHAAQSRLATLLTLMHTIPTVMVSGPCGSGKSTLVGMTLENTKKVITVSLDTNEPFTVEGFAQSILSTLGISYTPQGIMSAQALVERALKELKPTVESAPVLVVEADRRCDSTHLERLLLLLRYWGARKELVRPLVVMSDSTAAQGLTMYMQGLCVSHCVLPYMTEAEGEQLLFGKCKPLVEGCTEEELSQFCKEAVLMLGTRPLHLQGFGILLRKKHDHQVDREGLHQALVVFVAELTTLSRRDLEMFMGMAAGRDKAKQAALKSLCTALKTGPLPLTQCAKTLGMSREDFIHLVWSIRLCPFIIDVETEEVYLDAVVKRAVDMETLE